MLNLKLTLSSHSSSNRFRFAGLTLLLAIVALMPFAGSPDPAGAASTKRVTLGQKNMKFNPNCGRAFSRDCVAEGRITAFQSLSKRNPGRNFVVPFKGKIISWSIKLADPLRKETTFQGETYKTQLPTFNAYFGAPSQARIAVLRQVEKRKKGPPRFKLVRQSPVEILNPYFGTTVQFALSEPLNVLEGQVVGISIPTWAPFMWTPASCNASVFKDPACTQAERDYTWRASRGPDKCSLQEKGDTDAEVTAKIAGSHPQQKVDSVKRYGCYYGSNVLLYSATIVGK